MAAPEPAVARAAEPVVVPPRSGCSCAASGAGRGPAEPWAPPPRRPDSAPARGRPPPRARACGRRRNPRLRSTPGRGSRAAAFHFSSRLERIAEPDGRAVAQLGHESVGRFCPTASSRRLSGAGAAAATSTSRIAWPVPSRLPAGSAPAAIVRQRVARARLRQQRAVGGHGHPPAADHENRHGRVLGDLDAHGVREVGVDGDRVHQRLGGHRLLELVLAHVERGHPLCRIGQRARTRSLPGPESPSTFTRSTRTSDESRSQPK